MQYGIGIQVIYFIERPIQEMELGKQLNIFHMAQQPSQFKWCVRKYSCTIFCQDQVLSIATQNTDVGHVC